MKVVSVAFTALGVLVLGWILGMLAWKGVGALTPRLFLEVTPGPAARAAGLPTPSSAASC